MEIYRIMFIAGLTVAIIFLILAVVLFFVLKIPKAFGIATGRTQRKAIEQIRATGYESKVQRGGGRKILERIRARDAELENAEPEEETGEIEAKEDAAAVEEKPEAEEAVQEAPEQEKAEEGPEKQDKDEQEKTEKKEKPRVRIRAGSDRQWNLESEETEALGTEEPEFIRSYTTDPSAETTDILTPENSLETGMEPKPEDGSGFTDILTSDGEAILKGDLPKPEDMEIVEGQKIIVLLSETIVHTDEGLE